MKFLLQAFFLARQSMRMVLWIYAINGLLGLLILLPAYSTFAAGMGHSMAFPTLLGGFDYTVFSDFMKTSGSTITPLLSVGRWLGVLWLMVSVFLTGGILFRFSQPDEPWRVGVFLADCVQYFRRFAGLLGVVALFSVVLLVIVTLLGTLIGAALYNSVSEQVLFYVGLGTLTVALLVAALVFCIGDYAKVLLFRHDDPNPFRAFGRAGRLVLANTGQTFGPYLLLMGIGTALFGVYFLADSLIGMHNWPTIIILFVLQQAFIVSRIFLKVWSLGTAYGISTTVIQLTPVAPVVVVKPFIEPIAPIEPDAGIVAGSAAD